MNIKIKQLSKDAVLPFYAHADDAGVDLCNAGDEFTLHSGKTALVKTGIALDIPIGYYLAVCSRSGLSLKQGIQVHNAPGIVDSGYHGEIGVILFNSTKGDYRVKKGERIAQGILMKCIPMEFEIVRDFNDSERGEGGFGSSGEV